MKKRTQIVCTIGPASEKESTLKQIVLGGMKIARLNFSHGTYRNHDMLIRRVRKVSKSLGVPVQIMQDLQGPKIRVAPMKSALKVKKSQKVVIGKDFNLDVDIFPYVKPHERLLIQDGLIELVIEKVENGKVFCKVMNSGVIIPHKGSNFPDTRFKLPSLTEKDLKDLEWGLKRGMDMISISFVRTAEDLSFARQQIKNLLPKGFKVPKLVAKIEKPEAIKNIASIVKSADMIMIARGDLGVELPAEKVPVLQNKIIKLCKRHKKPVIVATQMLVSMVNNPRPTRAEVNDVADAVLDGADYVMLSEESAFGSHPVEAVTVMGKIINEVAKS